MDPSAPIQLLARRGKVQLGAAVPMKDIISGKALRFTYGPELDSEEDYFSDEETLGSKTYFEEQGVDTNIDLMNILPNFHDLDDPMWVEVPDDDGIVKKRIVRIGGIAVPTQAKVYFTYVGYLEGYTEPFDTAHILNPKASFLDGDALPGLTMGLRSMTVGEIAQIFVPPSYGYGELGCPDRIPGGVNIVFIVHLKQYIPKEKFQDPLFMTEEKLQVVKFREILKAVQGINQEGNQLLRSKNFQMAVKKYKYAINFLETRSTATEKEHLEREKILGTLYLNKCGAHLELQEPAKAIREGKHYLTLDHHPRKFKALYRIAKAHLHLGNLDEALLYCQESSIDPTNKEASDLKQYRLCRCERKKRL
ncbi:unnamed protein product [Allacma fusca]|uniref:peptidylprolyl isomerase n=1 Tax=Allacma fusca TaxID=39272 RepID=A0A8J2KYP0_9HEXA|nr:unnamed protein product [Allacma fusca]